MNTDHIAVTAEEDEAFSRMPCNKTQGIAAKAIDKMYELGYTWCESEKDWKVAKSNRLIDNL